MEKAYRGIAYFFTGVVVIIFIGFFRSYFSLLLQLDKVDGFHHLHASAMIAWLVLLVVQPILIRRQKYELHRWLGWFTYVLVPVMVFTMLTAYKVQYVKLDGQISREQNLGLLFLPFTDVLPFVTFYVLAIVHKNNILKHMRYIIGTALIVVGAGLVRILVNYIGVPMSLVFYVATLLTALLFVGFMVYDKIVVKKNFTKSPFLIIFLIWGVPNTMFFFFPQTKIWQTAAAAIATSLL